MKLLQAIFVGAVALMINDSVIAASSTCEDVKEEYETLWDSLEKVGPELRDLRLRLTRAEADLDNTRWNWHANCVGDLDRTDLVRPPNYNTATCANLEIVYSHNRKLIKQRHDEYVFLATNFMADLIRWEGLSGQIESACGGDAPKSPVDSGVTDKTSSADPVGNGDNVATCGKTKKGIRMEKADMKYNQRVNPAGYACNAGRKVCWKCPKGSSWGRGERGKDKDGRVVQYCGIEDDVPDCP